MSERASVLATPLGPALKDAALSGLITFGLTATLIGMRTTDAADSLRYRWGAVFFAVAIVFLGRLLLRLFVWGDSGASTGRKWFRLPGGTRLGAGGWAGKLFGPALLAFAIALPFLPFAGRYEVDLATLVLTYIMLGWGLNIVVGLAGLLDLGYVAFYAVGAYSFALIAQHSGLGFWFCLPLAGMLAALWGLVLGFPVLRLRGDYLAIVTLAFGEIIRLVLLNWYEFTGGPNGITNVPRPTLFGLGFTRGDGGFAAFFGLEFNTVHRIVFLYYVILVLALITNFATLRLRKLPVGRAWEAMREDEIACRSLGINTTNTKLTAFSIGAMFGGFAGSFFATRQGFISPESFVFMESALILAIVVLGGLGSQIGVVIAAIVMIGGLEWLRQISLFKDILGFDPVQYRLLIFGLVMVLIMVWRPRGLISTREPSIRLGPPDEASGGGPATRPEAARRQEVPA